MEEVPDTEDQPSVAQQQLQQPQPQQHQRSEQPVNQDDGDDEMMMMMREDADSDTGTDDSGLVMALDQDSVNGHRSDDHHHHPSNSGCNQAAGAMGSAGAVHNKTSERTRSTISEDKAAVSHLISYVSFVFKKQ